MSADPSALAVTPPAVPPAAPTPPPAAESDPLPAASAGAVEGPSPPAPEVAPIGGGGAGGGRTHDDTRAWWVSRAQDFYWDRFLTSFCAHPPLPLVPLLLLGLAAGAVGADYGVNHLFWHDDPLKQAVAGFCLVLVAAQCLLIGYLLDRKLRRPAYAPPAPGFRAYAGGIVACSVLTLAAVGGLAVAIGAFNQSSLNPWGGYVVADRPAPDAPPAAPATAGLESVWDARRKAWWGGVVPPLLVGGLAGVAAVWVAAVGLHRLLNRLLGERGPAPAEAPAVPDAAPARPPGYYALVVGLVVGGVAAFEASGRVFSVVDDRAGGDTRSGAVAAAATLLLLLAALFGLARWLFPVPLAGLLRVVRGDELPDGGPYRLHHLAVAAGALAVLAFAALSTPDATASPVVAGCLVLFLGLTAYGVLSYLFRRAVPVALAGLVVLGLVGGIPPYKLRFADLAGPAGSGYYRADRDLGPDEKGTDVRLANLDELARGDGERLAEYAGAVRAFMASRAYRAYKERTDLLNEEYPGGGPEYLAERQGAFLALQEEEEPVGLFGLRYVPYRAFAAAADRVAGNRLIPPIDTFPEERIETFGRGGKATYPLSIDDVAFRPAGRAAHDRPPLVVVSVSGGGLRAAAWTFRVLWQLEVEFARRGFDFPGHVRIIAGASGGMLGAAYFVSTLDDWAVRDARLRADPEGYARERDDRRRGEFGNLTKDFLTPLTNRMVYHDLPGLLSPWRAGLDRGERLQREWEAVLGDGMARRFDRLWQQEKAGEIPSLVFSPMLVEDGRRLLVSNLDLRYVASNDATIVGHRSALAPGVPGTPRDWNLSREAVELFRLFPAARGQVRLSTAVRMSASFPYFSPAVPLPTSPRRRVVDAGYYDNYGVSLAASYLFSSKHQDWLAANTSKVLLVQVRDSLSEDFRRLDKVRPEESTSVSRTLEELVTALEGLDSGRVGSASFRNDGQVELLTKFLDARRTLRAAKDAKDPAAAKRAAEDRKVARTPGFGAVAGPAGWGADPAYPEWAESTFATVLFELDRDASLSWYLTRREREAIGTADFAVPPGGVYDEPAGTPADDTSPARKVRRVLCWWQTPAP